MNCKNIENRITELANPANLPQEIKAHVENCDSCKQFYEVSLKLNDFFQERKSADADEFFFARVMNKINDTTESRPGVIRTPFLAKYRNIAASVLFIIALGAGILVGKYSANVYTNNNYTSLDETSDVMGIQLADNSFDLINFDE